MKRLLPLPVLKWTPVIILLVVALASCERTESDWKKSKETNTVASYQQFLANHPQGTHVDEATRSLDDLDWPQAKAKDTIQSYRDYLARNSRGSHISEAESRIEELVWAAADTPAAVQAYVDAYPNGHFLVDAQVRQAPVVLAAPASMGNGFELRVLDPSFLSGKPMGKDYITLEVPTSEPKEFQFYTNSEGYFVLMSPSDDVKGTRYGKLLMSDGRLCFQQIDELSVWVDWKKGTIYQNVDGKSMVIGETTWESYKSEAGEERMAIKCKGLGKDDKWCFFAGGKVYSEEPDGKITQIGWMGWRVVTPPKGDKLMVMMTKGMNNDAKWLGKHGGKNYIEK
jgi:hypothetical protein